MSSHPDTNNSAGSVDASSSLMVNHPESGESITTNVAYHGLHNPEKQFYQTLSPAERIALAKQVHEQAATGTFTPEPDVRTERGTVLETVNSTDLAVLSPAGKLYKIGDTIHIEVTPSSRRWGSSSTSKKEYTEPIDFVGHNSVGIPRMPTYSNVPSGSPSARFGKNEIEIVKRSDLDKYRTRLEQNQSVDVPKTVNGWELNEIEWRETDVDCIPTDIIKQIRWTNPNVTNTNITAHWRGGYNCWYLSTPTNEGVLSKENLDKYLYEIDVPHQVVSTEAVIHLAIKFMEAIPVTDFQDGYDLRDPSVIDTPKDKLDGFAPVEIPEKVGPWEITEREAGKITWRAQESKWNGFKLRMTHKGSYRVVYNPDEDTREHHDARNVRRFFPSGDPSPKNIECDYRWQRRDMFDDHWHHALAFMIQTGGHRVSDGTADSIESQIDGDVDIQAVDHGCCDDPHETKSGGMTLNDF